MFDQILITLLSSFSPTLFTIDSGSISSRNTALVVPSPAVSAPPHVTLLVCGAAAFLILCLAFASSVPQCSLGKLCVIRCCWLLKTFLTWLFFSVCLFSYQRECIWVYVFCEGVMQKVSRWVSQHVELEVEELLIGGT